MEKKNNTFSEFISPILVLVAICFVTTFALAFIYGITDPIIKENNAKAAAETRTYLLEASEGNFDVYDGDLYADPANKIEVTECYIAQNKSGMVVTAKSNSYGGDLIAMIGIDEQGAITAVQVTEASDTPGVGSKAQLPDHLNQYVNLTELTNVAVKKDANVNAVTGASVSSGAVHRCVYGALEQYKQMGGVK
ncbi:MAG: FMN-binding protein [Clostridiales bacterium]|nr:FMN-binding protein [Candidatus Crickella equi]